MPTPWEANRAALLSRDPSLVTRLEASTRPIGLQFFDARSGEPAARVPDANGAITLLCSQYDPVEEAEAFVRGAQAEGMMSYAVLGLGLGYHIEALYRAASPEALLFIFEPDAGLAKAVLEARDLAALLSSPRVHLIVGGAAEVFEGLEPHVVALFLGYRLVPHTPSLRRDPKAFQGVQKAILDLVDYGETALITATTISYLTKQNLCMNLPAYAFSPGVSALKDAWKGRPAVVIAAGPSLGKQLPLLKAARGRVTLICVGTALKPCLKAGVVPDLAATLDYSRLSAKYLEGLENVEVPLVVDSKGNWQAIEAYPGPKYFTQNPFLDNVLDHQAGRDRGHLDTGGTVANLCYSLAGLLGADPVIFVGLDLAYTHHTTHLPGTAIHEQWAPELNRFSTLQLKEWEQLARIRSRLREVPAQGGGALLTDDQMFTYLQKFQKEWRKASHRVIDATEGGAFKDGAEAMPLAEALKRFAPEDGPTLPHPAAPDPAGLRPALLASLDLRHSELSAVLAIYEDTLRRLRRIDRRFDDVEYRSRQLKGIEQERKAIARYRLMNELVADLAQGDEFARLRRDKDIAARRLEGEERMRAQLARDLDYLSGLKRAAEVLRHMMGIARARLEAWPQRVPWTDPPGVSGKEGERGLAVPGGPTR